MTLINPASLTATRNIVNNSYVDVAWPYTGNNGYRIYRSMDSGAYTLVHTITPTLGYGEQTYGSSGYGQAESATISWQDTTSTIASQYQYRIHTYDEVAAAEIPVGTLSGIVVALDVAWVVIYRTRYDAGTMVTWSEITGETGYKIYKSESGGSFSLVHTSLPDEAYWLDTGANNLKVNQYKVTVTVGLTETNGRLSNILNADACRAVTGVTSVKLGTSIRTTWTNVDLGDTLDIYRSVDGGPMTFLDAITPVTTTQYDDATVGVGHRYQYAVIQATATGRGVLAYSNEESVVAKITADWTRGIDSLNDEFFQVARKLPEINATISNDFAPILVGGMTENDVLEYVPMARAENPWVEVGPDTINLTTDDTGLTRSKFYVYSVRARDSRYNWSKRLVTSIQV